MNIFFEKTKSSEFIHYEKLSQLSMVIAKEYDKQPQNTKNLIYILSTRELCRVHFSDIADYYIFPLTSRRCQLQIKKLQDLVWAW